MSKDPLTHRTDGVLGFNEYIYVKNNPLKYVDPTGEEGEKKEEESWYSSAWNSTKDFTKEYGTKILDGTQFVLDIVGLVPVFGEPADAVNAIVYEARGDHLNAGLSAVGIIPFAGWLGTVGKLVNKSIKYSDEAVSLIKGTTKEVKQVEKVIDNIKKWEDVGITPGEAKRIQNAANKIGKPINVVGSRAAGTPNPMSDWDYLINGGVSKIKNSLPKGVAGGITDSMGNETGIDFFNEVLDITKPYIPFIPK